MFTKMYCKTKMLKAIQNLNINKNEIELTNSKASMVFEENMWKTCYNCPSTPVFHFISVL